MPNIASLLKQEISRLARRELNTETKAIRKSSAQYRRDIAHLKRQVTALSKQVAYLEQQERKRASSGASAPSAEGKRFSPRGVKAHRERLGLSGGDYGRLVGVSTQTIYNWERGKVRPQDEQLAALVEVRGMGKREALRRLALLEG